ncbi:MAG: hypothetical protein ACD_62C00002G0007 [uncultured bacterium]|nr:MAG: hypothetical protein ACD_62C00002G0007 [uncultured bacterium]
MNLEKLGILVLLKQLHHLDGIKKHVLASVREMLLATSESIELTNRVAEETPILQKWQGLEPLLSTIDSVIRFSVRQLSLGDPLAEQDNREDKMRAEIVTSIIQALDEEIESVGGRADSNRQLKIDALMAVRNVLVKQSRPKSAEADNVILLNKAVNE